LTINLDFLAGEAKRYPTFQLRMQTEATGLIREGDRMVGVSAQGPDEALYLLTDSAAGRILKLVPRR